MMETPEELLQTQLAVCLAAMQDCLAHAREPRDNDQYGHLRRNDLDYVAKLMKSSARLTPARARLKGQTRHDIHVLRGDAVPAGRLVDKGGRGRNCGG